MKKWWESTVIYQIYPRSFCDSNGDGIGDLPGIEAKLDHLVELGIDAIWISPIFPSPMVDFGYDVADYCDIDPMFGTLQDFDRLIAAAHSRGLKILLDFVPNHSSDRHQWFLESRSSRENPKRDWYLWRDPKPDGSPPNNWISDFGGPAWTLDEKTGQYYSHAFLPQQPDLNWRNPEVRKAMYDVLRFWFERGADGFRIDVLWHMIKAADFRDNPINPDYRPEMGEMFKVLQLNSTDQPEVHEIARDMRKIADEFGDRLLIGEIYLPYEKLMRYYGEDLDGVQLPFNFRLIGVEWDASVIAALIQEYEAALPRGGWPNWVLGNHDRARIAARVGEEQAAIAAMLLLTLRGTPTIYYGDELGIGHVEIPPERVFDPRELREPGLGLGRDPVRTPMPWDTTRFAGFSTSEPWLPLNSDWMTRSVAVLKRDPRSILNLYKRLLALRREHRALSSGDIRNVTAVNGVLSFDRTYEGETMTVVLNMTDSAQSFARSDLVESHVVFSTHDVPAVVQSFTLTLRENEGLILRSVPQRN